MKKKDLLRQVQALSGYKVKECAKVIDTFFDIIIDNLGEYDRFYTPIGKIAVRSKFNKKETKFNGGVVQAGYYYYLSLRPTKKTKETMNKIKVGGANV